MQALRYHAHDKPLHAFLTDEVHEGRIRIEREPTTRRHTQSSLIDEA